MTAALAGTLGGCAEREPVESTATPSTAVASTRAQVMSYAEARPVLEAHRDRLPADLQTKSATELESAWPRWAREHDANVRARLARGDDDSIVNLWMFGTSFTSRPRATAPDLAPLGGRAVAAEVLLARLDDLIGGLAAPSPNERLQFVRTVLERRGIDPATSAGRDAARAYLIDAHERMIVENDTHRRAAEEAGRIADDDTRLAAFASVFRDRGLSSDTSLPIDFAMDETLGAAKSQGHLSGPVRRVAIVGPGLDFTDKADGHDFYPLQTIQPFALIDSLVRLGLATPGELRLTTFDLSQRVNQHLEAAHARAGRGIPYVLQLPIVMNDPSHDWAPSFVEYWRRCGNAIGDAGTALQPPGGPTRVDVRTVNVRPGIVLTTTASDLNVVVERPARLADADRFDLVVATNVLVYYDEFEQALALQNIASMLKPGGFLVTNNALAPAAPMAPTASLVTTTYWDRQRNFDAIFWYKRK